MNGRATRGPGFVVQLETAVHPIRSAIKSRSFEAAEPGAPEMGACAIVSTTLQARLRPVGSNRSAGPPPIDRRLRRSGSRKVGGRSPQSDKGSAGSIEMRIEAGVFGKALTPTGAQKGLGRQRRSTVFARDAETS